MKLYKFCCLSLSCDGLICYLKLQIPGVSAPVTAVCISFLYLTCAPLMLIPHFQLLDQQVTWWSANPARHHLFLQTAALTYSREMNPRGWSLPATLVRQLEGMGKRPAQPDRPLPNVPCSFQPWGEWPLVCCAPRCRDVRVPAAGVPAPAQSSRGGRSNRVSVGGRGCAVLRSAGSGGVVKKPAWGDRCTKWGCWSKTQSLRFLLHCPIRLHL